MGKNLDRFAIDAAAWLKKFSAEMDWAKDAFAGMFGFDTKNTGNSISRRGEGTGTGPVGEFGNYYFAQPASMLSYEVDQHDAADNPPGSGNWITYDTPSANSTYEDSSEVPEDIYGEWTPYLEYLREESEKNTAFAVEQAEKQNAWQRETNQIQMDFNAAEAEKNRQWQEMMSNTAHVREVEDLKAAGLNPVLSATGGNGAAVTTGATASGATSSGAKAEKDQTFVAGLLSFLNNIMGYATSTAAAGISAGGVMGAAGLNSAATRYAADTAAAANMYGSDNSYMSAQNNPNSWAGLIRTLLGKSEQDYGSLLGKGWPNLLPWRRTK